MGWCSELSDFAFFVGVLFCADFFLGAEFTHVYAMAYSERIRVLPDNPRMIMQSPRAAEKLVALGTMTLFALFILLRARQKNKAPF